jgi:hypothetical protein
MPCTRNRLAGGTIAGALALAIAPPVSAHMFVQSYSLPIPFWMYAYGAAGALFLSFIVIGTFASVSNPGATAGHSGPPDDFHWKPGVLSPGSVIALALLVLCIVSGLAGHAGLFDNFNMTFFWIVFVLGVPYLAAFIGDFYARANPWEALVVCIERLGGHPFAGRLGRPGQWGHWPAVVLYAGFINLELFGHLLPRGLSLWLLAYSFVNVLGAWVLGRQAWFRQGEFFGVMLRLLGQMAPIARGPAGLRLRAPFSGLLEAQPRDFGLVVFVLFMLSSTAFDGLHGTQPWINFYWSQVDPHLVGHFGLAPRQQSALSAQLYLIWQRLALAASPFVYLGLFLAVLVAMKAVVRSAIGVRELAFRFTLSLIPIAFVYHVTHYFTLLLAQGGQIVRLISDPLGLGWNLFGTARWVIRPVMIDMGSLWHTQVGLILAGHVASVWVAHLQASTMFGSPRRAAISQLPMLVLMMGFTAFGLWILSLPLA